MNNPAFLAGILCLEIEFIRQFHREQSSHDLFLVKPAAWVLLVLSKGRDTPKTHPLIQVDGGVLVNPGFQAQDPHSLAAGILLQMFQHHLRKSQPTILRAHVHAFDLSILAAEQLDAAAPGRCAVLADEKECHRLGDQLLHTIAVAAFTWIEWSQLRFQFLDQGHGVGSIWVFRGDNGWHRLP